VPPAGREIWLVPDQDPNEVSQQLREWVEKSVSGTVGWELSVVEEVGQPPYVTPADHPALPVLADAMRRGFDAPVGWMRNAGGAPAGLLSKELGRPVVFFGTGLPEDRWHDSDESVRVDVLLDGAASLAHFWLALAAEPGAAGATEGDGSPADDA
jgi:acetylornithine deacetylase/succinyl-diaminopimelate desuccinylase-like protein